MADIKIGTVYKSSKHGHCEFQLVESDFINVAVYYESERLPWSTSKTACAVCGRYNGHQHFCTGTTCRACDREDGKDVYWKLVSVGNKVKVPVTDENMSQYVPAWTANQFYRKGVHDDHPCLHCKKYLTPERYLRHYCTEDCEDKIAYDKKYAEEIWHQRNCTNPGYYEAHKDEHDRTKINE